MHPVFIYFKRENELLHQSFCFLSDEFEHATNFVYEIQRELCGFIKKEMPWLVKVEYFSDGCANQYKKYKNMFNVCHHEEDFKLQANWSFIATSHRKSACDGIGGTVTRLTAKASLQRSASDQILNVHDMLNFCPGVMEDIEFYLITNERMVVVWIELTNRFDTGRTIPGTRSFHFFLPDNSNCIQFKRI